MAFDFRARANVRREAAEAEQRRKDEAAAELMRIANDLRSKFELFAKNDRRQTDFRATREAATVTFSSGAREVEVRVATPEAFDVRSSHASRSGLPMQNRLIGEDALMDYLDDWVLQS